MKFQDFRLIFLIILLANSCSKSEDICLSPTNIATNNITDETVDLSWANHQNGSEVFIEYGPSGFAAGSGDFISTSSSTITLSGLLPNTNYDVRLRSRCTDTFNTVSFQTTCGILYSGDLTLRTQQQVDHFSSFCYREIDGSLTIGGNNSDITSLAGLINLITIQNDLVIQKNDMLTSLNGLQNLQNINNEYLVISECQSLTNLAGLDSLTNFEFGSVFISSNNNLTSLSGIQSLVSSENKFEFFMVLHNPLLTSLNLDNLTECNFLTIQNNVSLTSLLSLDNLAFNKEMVISYNTNLDDFCALQNLFVNGVWDFEGVNIENNLFNPSSYDIMYGNCKP